MEALDRNYPAKLLLFGEHTVLLGFSSLAIPLPKYAMRWGEKTSDHPEWLTPYVSYLQRHCADFLNISTLQEWIEAKTIQSNIPIGYGLGSSGALTAAIYDICGHHRVEEKDIHLLQSELGKMESFFHGKSSGFDPLISFCNTPVIKSNGEITKVDHSRLQITMHCYLLDSGGPRSGKDMIAQFLENSKSTEKLVTQLGEENDKAISNVTGTAGQNLEDCVRAISVFQYELMPYMIIPQLRPHWREGIESRSYYIKICGAGGGGYYLVFSKKKLENIGPYRLEEVTL